MGAGPSSEFASHEMRITQGGKIRAWVEFSLKFFEARKTPFHLLSSKLIKDTVTQENEEKALVLHTLPAATKGKSKENERGEVAETSGLSASTATIPRLITVVEIIKREYLAAMNAKRSPHLVGLFQYNEMGSLEDRVENEREEEGEESAGDRMKMITEALAGSKNVQLAKTPYMKVTLCRKELAGMKDGGATAQVALKRKMSRSAKGRAKKAARKASENGKRE
ncbi:hypothetical protein V8E52_004171 [Russula decolorans]